MLEIQSHLSQCPACAEECRAVQQVRLVLRALPSRIPRRTLEARLVLDATRPALFFSTEMRLPRRGRRLARALALSCVTLLSLAVPAAFDGAVSRRAAFARVPVPGTVFVAQDTGSALPTMTFVRVTPLPQSALPLPQPLTVAAPPRSSLPSSVWSSADPLQTRFANSDNLSFAGYHSR